MKYIKTFESFIQSLNEGKVSKEDLPKALVDADKKDWGSITTEPTINKKENQISIEVHAGDRTVKKYLNDLIKGFGFKTKFDYFYSEGDRHVYTWWLK